MIIWLNLDFIKYLIYIRKEVKVNEKFILTKNGYGSMVVLSIEEYSRLTNALELALDEADHLAESTSSRLSHNKVFRGLKK